MLILVAGSPGTGKTVISRIMAEDLSCIAENSSVILRRGGAARPDPTGRFTEIIDEERAFEIVRRTALGSRGTCIIVETVYPDLWLEVPEVEMETAFIVLLRTHPAVLLERLEARGWPKEKIYENVVAEAFNVIAESLLDYSHSVFEVDTTRSTPEEALGLLYLKLERWEPGITIDWMSQPEVVDLVSRLTLRLDSDKLRLGV